MGMEGKFGDCLNEVPREAFLPEAMRNLANANVPLPIGYGQTNSQPATVALMLNWLRAEPGNIALDVGSGSGWTSGLLGYCVGSTGRVIAVEKVPELLEFGRDNCEKLGITNVEFHEAGRELGWPAKAPYDRILVSAAASSVPQELTDQLKPGGRMVIPIRNSIYIVEKTKSGEVLEDEIPGFAFVPLVGAA
jgi:protein-L-isoaspartate(D-aspartate) O-methyltransferase